MTSEEKQSNKSCKKSPSQLKRDKERKLKFFDNKSKAEAPTTETKAGKTSATEKAERDIIEGTKKALNVTDSEKDVTSFLDNLLKPKVPVRTNNTTEVKTTMEKKSLRCDNCSFEGQNQQDLKRHVELQHRGNTHSFGKDTKSKRDFNYKDISKTRKHEDKIHSKEQGRKNLALVAGLMGATGIC